MAKAAIREVNILKAKKKGMKRPLRKGGEPRGKELDDNKERARTGAREGDRKIGRASLIQLTASPDRGLVNAAVLPSG